MIGLIVKVPVLLEVWNLQRDLCILLEEKKLLLPEAPGGRQEIRSILDF